MEADHIVPMKEITGMPGFSQLSRADQLDILNMSDNFVGLSRSANPSKGSQSFGEWLQHKGTGTPVSPALRNEYMMKEAELKRKLQEEIKRRLKAKKDSEKDKINFRDQ